MRSRAGTTDHRSLANRRQQEAGFSLVELLVSSLVLLVVMGGLFTGLQQTQVYWEAYSDDMDLRQQARVALDKITDELRMVGYDVGNIVDVMIQAGDFSLQFVADIDNGASTGPCGAEIEGSEYGGAERVSYTFDVNSRTLSRAVDCWDGAVWVAGSAAAPVLVDLDPQTAIFQFMDATGTRIPLGGGVLDAELLAEVRSVVVVFDLVEIGKVQQVGDANTNLLLQTQVRLHNLELPPEQSEQI